MIGNHSSGVKHFFDLPPFVSMQFEILCKFNPALAKEVMFGDLGSEFDEMKRYHWKHRELNTTWQRENDAALMI